MNHDRTCRPVRYVPAPRLRDAAGSMPPHTYGVRVCSCAAFSTEPCRPTACARERSQLTAYPPPFRHTPNHPRPRPTTTVWRNFQQNRQHAPSRYSSFIIYHSSLSYTFSAKEKDSETGLSYFGSRYYSSDLSIWLSVDPMTAKYPSLSPYTYCADNPVKLVDPNGESTQVVDNGDGTYTVVGGNVKDGDNGIYLRKSDGSNGKLLAYSATPESFYNSETGEFKGRIDPNNQKGRNFLNNKVLKSGLLSYMIKARPEGPYDFKRTDGTNSVKYTTVDEFYRGMPIGEINGLPIWASARDVGNIAAGLVAGINGFSWDASRLAFDCLESIKDYNDTGIIGFSKESSSTQYAQRLGFMIGSTIYYNKTIKELSRLPSYGEYISKKLKPIPKPIIR